MAASNLADTYSIGEVADMVGMSAHTIRAWERRHAVVRPTRTASGQRRYVLDEVVMLKRVKDLASGRGLSLRVAAAAALGDLPDLDPGPAPGGQDHAGPGEAEGGVWRAVADLDPRLWLVLDGRGRLVDCNVAVARMAGRLRFEMTGTRFSELVDPYDRAKAVAMFRGLTQPRLDWEINLRTPVSAALYAFDCTPFRFHDTTLVSCTGRDLSLTV